ncbi:hypothetical protein SASPL_150139 [Salvia splendens]|uniref:EF-hand domain-containing protein n=1 Tax=Salvia splendens TaxID=180675 RepID=A0A8X8Z1H3_SALSN|nr:hypothetical protein SASPL_150139 [Salvia splendens]
MKISDKFSGTDEIFLRSVMEELQAIAEAHVKASSEKTQSKAKQFFTAMDSDRDGKVEMSEFSSFMSKKGYKLTGNPDFFKKLDMDGYGTLDFWESGLHKQQGYPTDDGEDELGDFEDSVLETATKETKDSDADNSDTESVLNVVIRLPSENHGSREGRKKTFDLCLRCYQSNAFQHDAHAAGPKFLDNYTLLHNEQASSNGLARMDVAVNTFRLAVDIFTNL